MMYRSGITVLDAIRSCEEIVGNKVLEQALKSAGQQIADGKNMTAAFQDLGLFPPLVIRMLRIGENTGALDTALLNVAYFYNREVRESIGKVQAMIEPALTLVLGAILGWVMLSVLGPVYDRYGITWGGTDYPQPAGVSQWASEAGWHVATVETDPTTTIPLADEAAFRAWLRVGSRRQATDDWSDARRDSLARDLMAVTPRDAAGAFRLPFGSIYLVARNPRPATQ